MNPRLVLVLHSHLPFVRGKGRWPFGEVWLFEAMAETYIPLVMMLRRLDEERLPVRLCLSLSPTLLEQLADPYMMENFVGYLEEKTGLAAADERRFRARGRTEMARLAIYYQNFYRSVKRDFELEMEGDIIGCIRDLRRRGVLEVLATAATHAYLPLIKDERSRRLQVEVGSRVYQQHLGEVPTGFWLPECGYKSGLDQDLADSGFKYFFVDSHAVEGGRPRVAASYPLTDMEVEEEVPQATGLTTYQAYRLPDQDLIVFGRNALISDQVWSADFGYPGHGSYREFHRSQELSGLKYWCVTSRHTDLSAKEPYEPERAARQAREHARHFAGLLRGAGAAASGLGFSMPLLVGCYDTELFGHWWWEGILWLEEVIRELAASRVRMVLPGEITAVPNALPPARVYESSWGTGGKHWGWYNEETAWMWDTIEKAVEQIETIVEPAGGIEREAYLQAWRELLLMESSDWFFMVTNNLTRDYALKRFFEHFAKLSRICDTLHSGGVNPEFAAWLAEVRAEDGLFAETM